MRLFDIDLTSYIFSIEYNGIDVPLQNTKLQSDCVLQATISIPIHIVLNNRLSLKTDSNYYKCEFELIGYEDNGNLTFKIIDVVKDNRRRTKRVPCDIECYIKIEKENYTGRIVNLSLGGTKFWSEQNLNKEEYQISFLLPTGFVTGTLQLLDANKSDDRYYIRGEWFKMIPSIRVNLSNYINSYEKYYSQG